MSRDAPRDQAVESNGLGGSTRLCTMPPGRRERLTAQLLGPEGIMWEWVIHSGSVLHNANDVATDAGRGWPPTIRRACAASAIGINAILFTHRRLIFVMNSSKPMTSFRPLK